MPFMFGRKPRAFKPMLHWSSLRHMKAPGLPPAPNSHNWLSNMPTDLGMMLNDTLGDCVCAATYHARQVWTYNANPPMDTQSDTEVQAIYQQYCGYKPGHPNTDQGCVEQSVLDD